MPTYRYTTAAAAGGLTTVDLSAGTSANDGNFDGSTSWGSSSTIVAAATHGRLDSGLDAAVRFSGALAPPVGARALHLRVTMTTPPGANSSGGVAELYVGAGTQTTLATNEGYQAAWRMTTGGDVKVSGACDTWGNILSNGETTTGTMVMDMYVWLDGSTATAASVFQTGSTAGVGQVNESSNLTTSVTNLYAYIGVGMVAASPSATITWAGVTLAYEWVI